MEDEKETPEFENRQVPGEEGGEPQGAEAAAYMEEALRQARMLAQERHDAWLRAKAEAENTRKRAEQEAMSARKYALEKFAAEILPVVDSLEAALDSPSSSFENLKEGVEITQRQLKSVFERFAITEVNPVGQKFDPNLHQAMGTEETQEVPSQSVTRVLQKGYMLWDRLLRPALVMVAKAPESEPKT